ncbi:MAG TPA: KUP/HAK/KT family potassium transporter [Victivallales bacterium]|nr:KUP/HAK/KT family potassium transporter [Victivallales bacterium]
MSKIDIVEKLDVNTTMKSLGLVFGDIGTSPIYTLTVIFLLLKPTESNIIGILSLIIWTLTIIVSVKYVWLAMSLSKKGEGGTVVLMEILLPMLKKSKNVVLCLILAYLGISLLIGDGIITPAISILSAVEGIRLLPHFHHISQDILILIASLIACLLLCYQHKGTEKVAKTFSPIMMIWFAALFFYGIIYFIQMPSILKVISPYYALNFLYQNGFVGFLSLSEVILCATGGEALYADMGHLRRRPITQAWCIVFIALLFNYLGQGAYLIKYADSTNILFGMVYHFSPSLYIPFLVLSIFATVIASQAMISGIFSIVYQAITTRLMPMLKIDYTSDKIKGQIYIGTVNWFLLAAILIIMLIFRTSDKLAAAYGLAVMGAVVFAGIMMIMIFHKQKNRVKLFFTIIVTSIASVYFASTLFKIPYGGYWSLILACIPLGVIVIFTLGQKKLFKTLRPLRQEVFLHSYKDAYSKLSRISGTGLFLVRDIKHIPPYVAHTIFKNEIIYDNNIFVSIIRKNSGPYGVHAFYRKDLAPGLKVFEIRLGYMELENVEKILRKSGIREKTIFYGQEEIMTNNLIWKIFAFMKRNVPSYVQFYKLPPNELHGVISRVKM